MKITPHILFLSVSLAGISTAQTKPLVLIKGDGNVSVQSTGEGAAAVVGGVAVGGGAHHAALNKHNQTMEMAQNMLTFCPALEVTLDDKAQADYIVFLNREGTPTMFGEIGQSQVMVLNALKSPIFVSKKATVKNAVKSSCNAVSADWQAHGRIRPVVQQPMPDTVPTAPQPQPVVPQTPQQSALTQEAKADVALVLQTTASANKYCKPETISSVLNDTNSYLMSKGMKIGQVSNSKSSLVLILNRPISKWLEITIQGRDGSGNLLWSEKISKGGGLSGSSATVELLEKVHNIIDTRLPSPSQQHQAE